MNQRESLLILFEATADLPETVHLRRARRWAEKRLEVLRRRYARMRANKVLQSYYNHVRECRQCLLAATRKVGVRCAAGQECVDNYKAATEEAAA